LSEEWCRKYRNKLRKKRRKTRIAGATFSLRGRDAVAGAIKIRRSCEVLAGFWLKTDLSPSRARRSTSRARRWSSEIFCIFLAFFAQNSSSISNTMISKTKYDIDIDDLNYD
jgi:hypothetical protein